MEIRMRLRLKSLRQCVGDLKYFDPATRKGNMVEVFNISKCEICEIDLSASNGFSVGDADVELEAIGLKARARPLDEGGYSELHDLATCSECCYNPDARSVNFVVKDDIKSTNILDRMTDAIQTEWEKEKP